MLKLVKPCKSVKNYKINFSAIRNYSFNQNSSRLGLAPGYQPSEIDKNEEPFGYFEPEITAKEPFRMILPPPNITGDLHLGHALTVAIEDVICRWKRMDGSKIAWVPGIDHAGIATQVIVEKRLWSEMQKTRQELGRKLFLENVYKWKEEKEVTIENQLRLLGASLDWSRKVFTMDRMQSEAVTEAFIRLFDQGLIYRSEQLVNWSCVLQSAISDIEVDEKLVVDGPTLVPVPGYENPVEFGVLTLFAYKFTDSDEEIVVATTRPETIPGDVAIAVNPLDNRYNRFIGRNVWHPFRQQEIPIIGDDFVDPNFGTGAVKITPAHDRNDFAIGQRHNLKSIQVIDERGVLTDFGFMGAPRFLARAQIISNLTDLGLFRERRPHQMVIPICSRSKDIVELQLKPQWFVKCQEMAQEASNALAEGRLQIEPKLFEKNWSMWMDDIRDWNISRQLWWGHQIPAYNCRLLNAEEGNNNEIWVAARNLEEARNKAADIFKVSSNSDGEIKIEQDEDVLDTWFSSALMPFSVFGWPQQTEDLSRYYPLDLMETGHDILFFWVARMVMLGTKLTGQLPFPKILFHGIICDAQGRKMSKSLGNVIAPEQVISGATLQALEMGLKGGYQRGLLSGDELNRAVNGQKRMFPKGIPECGTDALRFTLCSHNTKSHYISFDVQECYTNKLFCNKIWQATKFTNLWLEQIAEKQQLKPLKDCQGKLSLIDLWILSRLSDMVQVVNEALEKYDFHVATAALKNFLYYEFCDIYLEASKRGLREIGDGRDDVASLHCWTLRRCLDVGLRALAPFMPRLSKHLHRNLMEYPGEPDCRHYPKIEECGWRNVDLEIRMTEVMKIIVAIRRLKKIFGIGNKHRSPIWVLNDPLVYADFHNVIRDLSGSPQINFQQIDINPEFINDMIMDRVGLHTTIYISIPDELRKSFELDFDKLDSKMEKIVKELEKVKKMISGSNYKVKATPESQKSHQNKILDLEEKMARINYIKNLYKQL